MMEIHIRGLMRKILRALALFVTVVALFMTSGVQAAQSNGLGVSPRKDFTVQPGKNVTDTLYISNLSLNQDLQVGIRLVDFGAANESGTPALQLAQNAPQTPWSLKPFIKVQTTVRIAAGKSANVPFTITIPATQGAGSYYSAVEYTAQNPETKEKVNISASTASLVFVTVPGDAKEQLTLKKFGAYESYPSGNGIFKNMFMGAAPKELAYRLENQGNIAEQPSGSIVIKNMFGRTAKEIEDANPKKQLVLLGQTRRIQVCMKSNVLTSKAPTSQETQQASCDDPGLLPGRYTAQMALYYGLNGSNTQEIVGKATFWYIPWWSIILLGVMVLLLAGLVWLIRRAMTGGGRRKYRR